LRLKRLAKPAKHASTRGRASIVLGSNARVSAPSIPASWLTDANRVRKVIREFTSGGFDSLCPDCRGGRRRRIERDHRQPIVAIAGNRLLSQVRGWHPLGVGASTSRGSDQRVNAQGAPD
jgi:hypothetical protein